MNIEDLNKSEDFLNKYIVKIKFIKFVFLIENLIF